MADAIKEIGVKSDTNAGQGADSGPEQNKSDERSDRTDKRIGDLLGKVEKTSALLEEERKARKELEFDLNFERQSRKYPNAPELKDAIKAKVTSGVPLEDAVIAELHRAGKLQTSEQILKENMSNNAVGGSADTKGVSSAANKPNSELSSAEMRAKLVDMESRGEIRVT